MHLPGVVAAIGRETMILAALASVATAGVVVAIGALILFRRERQRPRA